MRWLAETTSLTASPIFPSEPRPVAREPDREVAVADLEQHAEQLAELHRDLRVQSGDVRRRRGHVGRPSALPFSRGSPLFGGSLGMAWVLLRNCERAGFGRRAACG